MTYVISLVIHLWFISSTCKEVKGWSSIKNWLYARIIWNKHDPFEYDPNFELDTCQIKYRNRKAIMNRARTFFTLFDPQMDGYVI